MHGHLLYTYMHAQTEEGWLPGSKTDLIQLCRETQLVFRVCMYVCVCVCLLGIHGVAGKFGAGSPARGQVGQN